MNIKALHTKLEVGMKVKLKENKEWYTVESVSHRHPIITLKGVDFPVHLVAVEKYTANWRKGLTKQELDVIQTLEARTGIKGLKPLETALETGVFKACHAPYSMICSYTSSSDGRVVIASIWKDKLVEAGKVFSSIKSFEEWRQNIANEKPPLKPGLALAERAASCLGWI